jgi:acylphosphatase
MQGVSFHIMMKERAIRQQTRGWVRNREDGAVEALVQGREDQIQRMIRWAESGPPSAVVKRILLEKMEEYPWQVGFTIVY